jgi:hypothetical protein
LGLAPYGNLALCGRHSLGKPTEEEGISRVYNRPLASISGSGSSGRRVTSCGHPEREAAELSKERLTGARQTPR